MCVESTFFGPIWDKWRAFFWASFAPLFRPFNEIPGEVASVRKRIGRTTKSQRVEGRAS